MSKFNRTMRRSTITTNYEDGKVYKTNPYVELYSLVVTCLMEDKFYESGTDQLIRLKDLIRKVDPEFVMKLAIYAREQMYLRSIPIVLLVELLKIHSEDSRLSKSITRVIQRVDQITEFLAYYQIANSRTGIKKLNKLSKQLQKGIAESFDKFDEYQFAKYNRKTEVKIKDALFLCHVKPKNKEQEELFKKIIEDTLEIPYTWETQISERGNKKEVWEELIDSKKLGYMALIRNSRNILNTDVSSEHITKMCEYLSNRNAVRKSKQFPFRFFSAYRELVDNNSFSVKYILNALEKAVKISIENISFFENDPKCVIACDVSSSMETTISGKSKTQLYDIGLLLGQLVSTKIEKTVVGIFGDTWSKENFTSNDILANTINLHRIEGKVGYSTNGYKVIDWMISNNIMADKVMVFTDCQLWDSSGYNRNFSDLWSKYKKINPKCKLYLFDLAGHGTTPVSINENDVYLISGWSEKIFDMMKALEEKNNIIDQIKKMEI